MATLLEYEFPVYADMKKFLGDIKPKITGSLQHNIDNLQQLLELCANMSAPCSDELKQKYQEQIEEMLR